MKQNQQAIFGIHTVTFMLQRQPERVTELQVQQGRQDDKMQGILQLAKQAGIAVQTKPKKTLDNLTNDANHQGVVAFCQKRPSYTEADLVNIIENTDTPPLLLVLDMVQDPHNLGACFRSADAAGAHAIIAPKDKAVGITPVVSKVSTGAVETVPFVQVTNLARTLRQLKDLGVWIYGAAGEAAQSIYQTDLTGPVALVLGAEGEGLRRLTREHCDALVNIPMHGMVSSLNVSVATGICLFEAVRQRL